jgi:hypothetical protein
MAMCNTMFGPCICGAFHDMDSNGQRTDDMRKRSKHNLKALQDAAAVGITVEQAAANIKANLEAPLTDAKSRKETNPKDAVGSTKVPMSRVPVGPLMEVAVALHEGHVKDYRGHNWRVAGVRGSIYYDAAMRHLMKWYEGQDLDPDSGINHISKAIAGLMVLRDAMMHDNWTDDRPPKTPEGLWDHIQELMDEVNARYPNPKKGPYTEVNDGKSA